MELVDAHCHFDFPEFDGQRRAILDELSVLGVSKVVIPGVRSEDWERVINTAAMSSRLFYCVGVHPWFVQQHGAGDLTRMRALLEKRPDTCVAVGECGLDRLRGDPVAQLPWFEAQLDLAAEFNLPLVIHSVRTHDEVGAILRRRRLRVPVLIHGFSGSKVQAQQFAELGCYIGVGGVVTHPRASKTRAAIAELPVDRLVLESDAPDMAPVGVKKGENSPVHLEKVLMALAALRAEEPEALASSLMANVSRLYGWDRANSK